MSEQPREFQMQPGFNSLGFPSVEYITWNLQSLAHYAMVNGGAVKVPLPKQCIKTLPLKSMIIHVYENKTDSSQGYLEARLIYEKEFLLEKSMTKEIKTSGGPLEDTSE